MLALLAYARCSKKKLNQSWKLRALLIPVNWINKRTHAINLEQSSTYQKLVRNLPRVATKTYFASIALDYSCILQFRSMEWGCLMCTNIDDAIHTSINSHAEFCFHLKVTSRRRRRKKIQHFCRRQEVGFPSARAAKKVACVCRLGQVSLWWNEDRYLMAHYLVRHREEYSTEGCRILFFRIAKSSYSSAAPPQKGLAATYLSLSTPAKLIIFLLMFFLTWGHYICHCCIVYKSACKSDYSA